MKAGGFTDSKQITDEIKELTKSLKTEIEDKVQSSFELFEPISYKSQVVAGTNYLVKIKVGEGEYVHAKIYKTLPHAGSKLSLTDATTGHTEQTEL